MDHLDAGLKRCGDTPVEVTPRPLQPNRADLEDAPRLRANSAYLASGASGVTVASGALRLWRRNFALPFCQQQSGGMSLYALGNGQELL